VNLVMRVCADVAEVWEDVSCMALSGTRLSRSFHL